MKVLLSLRGARSAERINAHWRANADDPNVFARELVEIIDRLALPPTLGVVWPTARRPALRRVLLEKSRCHVYFEVNERQQVISILQIWDSRRGRAPQL